MSDDRRIPELAGLRGIAIPLISIFHYGDHCITFALAGNPLLDLIAFGPQTADIAYGRRPSGSAACCPEGTASQGLVARAGSRVSKLIIYAACSDLHWYLPVF